MGNRATKVNDGVTENYSYNNVNMLLTRGTNNYTNDLDGNTLAGAANVGRPHRAWFDSLLGNQ